MRYVNSPGATTKETIEEEVNSLRNKGFKYITRSKHGELVAHKKKPTRETNYWSSDYNRRPITNTSFVQLKWEDDPLYIGKGRTKQ